MTINGCPVGDCGAELIGKREQDVRGIQLSIEGHVLAYRTYTPERFDVVVCERGHGYGEILDSLAAIRAAEGVAAGG